MAEYDCKDFRDQVESGLRACAKWLDNHAQELAGTFAGGCKNWSVEFAAGEDGIFPNIRIYVNKIDDDIIDAFGGFTE